MIPPDVVVSDIKTLVRAVLSEGNERAFIVVARGRVYVSPYPADKFRDSAERPQNLEVQSEDAVLGVLASAGITKVLEELANG